VGSTNDLAMGVVYKAGTEAVVYSATALDALSLQSILLQGTPISSPLIINPPSIFQRPAVGA
jgi:hypothetical protein